MSKILYFLIAGLVTNSDCLLSQFTGENCIVSSEFIYQPEDVPFASCHASTIIQIGKGLMAAWFGGTAERNPDVCIWVSRHSEGKWSIPVKVADGTQHKDKRYPWWNPVLFNAGKQILLFYKVGPSSSEWWGKLKTSDDSGKTWSKAYRLQEDITGPVRDKPVLLDNGILLCPSSTGNDGWRLHMEFTSDYGLTWERTAELNEKNIRAIQPAILRKNSGNNLQALSHLLRTGMIRRAAERIIRITTALQPMMLVAGLFT